PMFVTLSIGIGFLTRTAVAENQLQGENGKSASVPKAEAEPWITIPGGNGPGKGKTIILVSGDEEYRSEEALPQLAKILAKRHGFTCIVLFAIDPRDGTINPNVNANIP